MPDDQAREIENIIESGPTPGTGDKATEMLSELFGSGWTEILWSGQKIQGDASLIMPILNVFNVIMLAAVSLILLYVATHAFVGSAHEGTPLGRRLHSVWVPVRSVLAISLLAPIPWAPMLNFVQGIVLVFVGFSIQFANMATNVGIDFLAKNHGQVVASVPHELKNSGSHAAEVALHNYLIQYHQYWFQENVSLVRGYTKEIKEPEKGFFGFGKADGPWEIDYRFKNPEPFSKDVMGNIVLQCKDPNSTLCGKRESALEGLLSDMEEVASRKVEQLYGEDSSPPSELEVLNMIADYGERITKAVKKRIDEDNPEFKQELDAFGDAIKEQGFVMLGSYFWTMSRFSMALQDQVGSSLSVEDYSDNLLERQMVAEFNQLDVSLSSMDSYFRRVEHNREIAGMGSGSIKEEEVNKGNILSKVIGKLNDFFSGYTTGFMEGISSEDPISSLAAWGHTFANGTLILIGGLFGLSLIPAAGFIAKAALLFLAPPLLLLSFTLAYYLPAVPFIIWIVSLFGWILMVLEALIAAPVWAAMHASPDGEGLAGDKGAEGYVIFTQVLLRPVLMVIGFFFALLLVHVVSYAGEMFNIFFHGVTGNETFAGPFTMFAGMFMGSVIMIMLVHKAFNLVYWLPEGVAKWMGGVGTSSMGEGNDMSSSKSTVIGGAAMMTPRATTRPWAGKDKGGKKEQLGGGEQQGGGEAAETGGGREDSAASDLQSGETT